MLSAHFSSHSFKVRATTTIIALMLLSDDVRAQIASDNTTNTKVQTIEDVVQITGGIRSGNNLFHSFEQFSLTSDRIANFDHSLEIENVFSRVTGGAISEIEGSIQTQGGANLFLLNPAGIIFGANARLNVGGSFIATTGDRLIFADETDFSADLAKDKPLLTVSFPVGLQYGSSSGEIRVLPNTNRAASDNGLNIQPGNTLALLGGDVSIVRNSLGAVGSNVEIGSVKSGTVALQADESGWQFDYSSVENLASISLRDGAFINSSGRVSFQGNTINLSTGSGIRNFTSPNGVKSTIELTATESIVLDRGLSIAQVGQQRTAIDRAIADVAGDITLDAPQIWLNNGSVISAGTLSDGAGGNITINADTVTLSSEVGNPSIVSTSTRGIGNGGQIRIDTGKLTIRDGSQIQALAGEGAGGTITVNASEAIDLSGTGIWRSRDSAGNLSTIELTSGFSASSGIKGLPATLQPQGKSGNLAIDTPYLSIAESAQISVSNYGLADAGDIKITTSTLSLDTAGEIVANTASGIGGSIDIVAEELVILDRASAISTTAARSGNGGNIAIETDNLVLLESNRVSADAKQGKGGNVAIDTQGLFVDPASSITASSEVEQNEGRVDISTLDLNSRFEIDYREQSLLSAENKIDRSCGVGTNRTSSEFRDIGRGGIPNNLLKETAHSDTLADLNEYDRSDLIKSAEKAKLHFERSEVPAIAEATTWIVNSKGVIELIAKNPTVTVAQSSLCQLD